MPLVNRQFWLERLGSASPCWSGDKWLDWEHGIIARSAYRRIFPKQVMRVLDIGCGDGSWSKWVTDTFGVTVMGTDAIVWPGVSSRISFIEADAELIDEHPAVKTFRPELAVFMNSLTCVADWKKAIGAACRVSDRVLAFDNFMTPTPPWWKGLPHRNPITLPELVEGFKVHGFSIEKIVAADLFHRRLFLSTPKFLHSAVAVTSVGLDLLAARLISPKNARHSGVLFYRNYR